MTRARPALFQCESCGTEYRWREELAGRTFKCRCGAALLCPREPLEPLAPDVQARVGGLSGHQPQATSPTLAYHTASPEDAAVSRYFPDRLKDLQIPLWLIAAATAIELVAGALGRRGGTVAAMFDAGVQMLTGTGIMLAAMFIAARFRGINLGPLPAAALKLAAISLAPGALITLMSPVLGFMILGWAIAWIGAFVLYFALLGALFDLDESDTWYCVCIIFLVNLVVYFGMMWVR